MKSVKVYSTAACPYCTMAKDFLKSKNVPFESFDVGQDRGALATMKEKSGQLAVPVIDIEGTIIVGFDKDAIAKALGI